MTKPTPEKRPLHFETLDDILTEVRSLHETGYTCKGNWNLAQICSHLSDWMRFPLDGYPVSPLPIRIMLWMMRTMAGSKMQQKILTEGFKAGTPTMPETIPEPDAQSDQAALDQLQKTIDRIKHHQGEFQPSPLFGNWDRETMEKINLRHAEHHLGFLVGK